MEGWLTWRLSAWEALTANSTAWRLSTGRAPGMPRQTGQTLVLGSEPKTLGQAQKILVWVSNCTCTSRPMTVSYLERRSTGCFAAIAIMNTDYNGWRGARWARSQGKQQRQRQEQ